MSWSASTGSRWARPASSWRATAILRLGLADASLIILAARYGTRRVLSFDERAFGAVAPLQGGAFTLLPADR